MPRGHAPKRETRKPKKRAERKAVISTTAEFTSADVEVVPRRRKARANDESDKE